MGWLASTDLDSSFELYFTPDLGLADDVIVNHTVILRSTLCMLVHEMILPDHYAFGFA